MYRPARAAAVAAILLALVACDRAAPARPTPSPAAGTASGSPTTPPVVTAAVVDAAPVPLVTRPWGGGAGGFGRYAGREGATAVPSAVLAAADGELLVLDAANTRLVRFGADGRHLGDIALPIRRSDAVEVTAAVYDAKRGIAYVLDTATERLVAVTGQRVRVIPVRVPARDGARVAGLPLTVAPDGTVCGSTGSSSVPLAYDGEAVPHGADPFRCASERTVGLAGRDDAPVVDVTVGTPGSERRAAVGLPGERLLDAHAVASPGEDTWLFVNVLRDGRPAAYVVRLSAALDAATATPVRYEPPGDIVEPVAVVDGGAVVLSGTGGGMSLVRYGFGTPPASRGTPSAPGAS